MIIDIVREALKEHWLESIMDDELLIDEIKDGWVTILTRGKSYIRLRIKPESLNSFKFSSDLKLNDFLDYKNIEVKLYKDGGNLLLL